MQVHPGLQCHAALTPRFGVGWGEATRAHRMTRQAVAASRCMVMATKTDLCCLVDAMTAECSSSTDVGRSLNISGCALINTGPYPQFSCRGGKLEGRAAGVFLLHSAGLVP